MTTKTVKLPSGAVVKVRRLRPTELRYAMLSLMVEKWVDPGMYQLDEEGKLKDPLTMLMADAQMIETAFLPPCLRGYANEMMALAREDEDG